MNYQMSVENIKCGGCASTITSRLKALEGVTAVEVDIAEGIVSADAGEGMGELLTTTLLNLGYPESGTAEGMAAAKAKAKSFVSCAVGRMKS
ncbi:MAG: heavy-metal-associated domain-containing protein [Gammaproteobacteria bacterium]